MPRDTVDAAALGDTNERRRAAGEIRITLSGFDQLVQRALEATTRNVQALAAAEAPEPEMHTIEFAGVVYYMRSGYVFQVRNEGLWQIRGLTMDPSGVDVDTDTVKASVDLCEARVLPRDMSDIDIDRCLDWIADEIPGRWRRYARRLGTSPSVEGPRGVLERIHLSFAIGVVAEALIRGDENAIYCLSDAGSATAIRATTIGNTTLGALHDLAGVTQCHGDGNAEQTTRHGVLDSLRTGAYRALPPEAIKRDILARSIARIVRENVGLTG